MVFALDAYLLIPINSEIVNVGRHLFSQTELVILPTMCTVYTYIIFLYELFSCDKKKSMFACINTLEYI